MVVHIIKCRLEKVLNAQSLLLLNSLKSKRLARSSIRRVGHTPKNFIGSELLICNFPPLAFSAMAGTLSWRVAYPRGAGFHKWHRRAGNRRREFARVFLTL